ncbi:MAG: hypothetical protein MZV63_33465 [Marinilabiliales bacterium]|nr:hypothetical protein [Marinilabiliales bacterium]
MNQLRGELERARVVPVARGQPPRRHDALRGRCCAIPDSRQEFTRTLSYPDEADVDTGRIAVVLPPAGDRDPRLPRGDRRRVVRKPAGTRRLRIESDPLPAGGGRGLREARRRAPAQRPAVADAHGGARSSFPPGGSRWRGAARRGGRLRAMSAPAPMPPRAAAAPLRVLAVIPGAAVGAVVHLRRAGDGRRPLALGVDVRLLLAGTSAPRRAGLAVRSGVRLRRATLAEADPDLAHAHYGTVTGAGHGAGGRLRPLDRHLPRQRPPNGTAGRAPPARDGWAASCSPGSPPCAPTPSSASASRCAGGCGGAASRGRGSSPAAWTRTSSARSPAPRRAPQAGPGRGRARRPLQRLPPREAASGSTSPEAADGRRRAPSRPRRAARGARRRRPRRAASPPT